MSLNLHRSSLAGAVLLLAALTAPRPARACPPSLVVEPTSDTAAAGGAFLMVRAVPGCHPGALTVSGIAEGLVGGERRSAPLELVAGPAPDVYLVRRQWPREGVWVLRLTVTEGDGHATALVGIGRTGAVVTVRQPARRGSIHEVSEADVATLLRSLAAG